MTELEEQIAFAKAHGWQEIRLPWGEQFTDILIRRQPHYDKDILRDVTPVRGWIGQVPTGSWEPFEGVSKIGHRIRRMFPDLSGCWQTVTETGCLGNPCDPDRKKVCFGYDQFTYALTEIYYETDIFCFPLIMSADAAKEQFAALITGLREATVWIWNQRHRMDAVQLAKNQVVVSASNFPLAANATWNSTCTAFTTTADPTSMLTIQYLQRWVDILILEGYMGENPLPMSNVFELITDAITGTKLREENPALSNYVTSLTVQQFADLYKYGIASTIGNFALHYDPTPLRFQATGAPHEYQMLQPYANAAAAAGIGADYSYAYVNGRYQWDIIWHRSVMRSLVRRTAPINSQMPFASIDYGGRWQFVMDNMTTTDPDTGLLLPVNNEMRNKGKFIANYSAGTKPEHTEWAVAMLSLRELSCLADQTPCQTAYPYVYQDYSSSCTPCPNEDLIFDASGATLFGISSASCNGVPFLITAVPSQGSLAALVIYLNLNYGVFGTWTASGTNLVLSGSTCSSFGIVFT